MKQLATFLFLILIFGSCEKEPEELLIGTWDDIQSDIEYVRFGSDGKFSRHYDSEYAIDVCDINGKYSIHIDTLIIEEYIYCWDTTLTTTYSFTVSKEDLQLKNLKTKELKDYKRK